MWHRCLLNQNHRKLLFRKQQHNLFRCSSHSGVQVCARDFMITTILFICESNFSFCFVCFFFFTLNAYDIPSKLQITGTSDAWIWRCCTVCVANFAFIGSARFTAGNEHKIWYTTTSKILCEHVSRNFCSLFWSLWRVYFAAARSSRQQCSRQIRNHNWISFFGRVHFISAMKQPYIRISWTGVFYWMKSKWMKNNANKSE